MMCFHVVLLFYCFITSLFHSTGCYGEDQFGCAHALCSKASFNLVNRFTNSKFYGYSSLNCISLCLSGE